MFKLIASVKEFSMLMEVILGSSKVSLKANQVTNPNGTDITPLTLSFGNAMILISIALDTGSRYSLPSALSFGPVLPPPTVP